VRIFSPRHYFVRRFILKIGARLPASSAKRWMDSSATAGRENVRELENIIERAVFCRGERAEVAPDVLPEIAAVAHTQAAAPRPRRGKGPAITTPQSIIRWNAITFSTF